MQRDLGALVGIEVAQHDGLPVAQQHIAVLGHLRHGLAARVHGRIVDGYGVFKIEASRGPDLAAQRVIERVGLGVIIEILRQRIIVDAHLALGNGGFVGEIVKREIHGRAALAPDIGRNQYLTVAGRSRGVEILNVMLGILAGLEVECDQQIVAVIVVGQADQRIAGAEGRIDIA